MSRESDGHTGVEYEVLSRLSVQPRADRLAVVLTRLREADWRQHYIVHFQSASGVGRILASLCGAKPFQGCPVVGDCRYAVLLSRSPGERAPHEPSLKDWFARFVAALDEASRHFVRAAESWGAGRVVLAESGLFVPPLEGILQAFSPGPGEVLRLPDDVWSPPPVDRLPGGR